MRLAHKRNVQLKLKKQKKTTQADANVTAKKVETKKTVVKKTVAKKVAPKATDTAPKVTAKKTATKAVETSVTLTPKQQEILDIVSKNKDGINPKGIGLEAGQEDAKAASWATGGLKKLLEENLITKEQAAGNKVIYKAV